MDPMNRKLFKSRDARNKLRGMGGIMASSPELAQTVQQFQAGGRVRRSAGFGDTIEYNYATFLREMGLRDTPDARDMFRRYQDRQNTKYALEGPKNDPSLFLPTGFDRAASGMPSMPGTSDVSAPSARRDPAVVQAGVSGLPSGSMADSLPAMDIASFDLPEGRSFGQRFIGDPLRAALQPVGDAARDIGQPIGDRARDIGQPIGDRARDIGQPVGDALRNVFQPSSAGLPAAATPSSAGLPAAATPSSTDLPATATPSSGQLFRMSTTDFNQPRGSQVTSDAPNDALLRSTLDAALNRSANASDETAVGRMGGQYSGGLGLRGMSPERLEAERLATESGGLRELGLDAAEAITGGVRGAGEVLTQQIGETASRLGAPGLGSYFLGVSERTGELSDIRAAEERAREAARQDRLDVIADAQDMTRGDGLDFDPATDLPQSAEGDTPVLEPKITTPDADTPVPDADTPAPETGTDTPAPDTGTGTGTATVDPKRLDALMPSPDDTEDDIRAKYKDRLALLQDVLGEDEAGARNKGMDLAMIGLAIMSGQSPNALTNIAQGGAAGLKAMSARDEAERDRQRLIRTTALEGVLEEEAAGTAAAASAAEKEKDRQNALAVARMRNLNALDTKTDPVTYRTLFDSAFKAATDFLTMPEEVRNGTITAVQYADKVAKAGLAGSRGKTVTPATTAVPRTQEQVQAAVQARVDAAKDDPAALAAIKQSLINKGMDPSTYGIK